MKFKKGDIVTVQDYRKAGTPKHYGVIIGCVYTTANGRPGYLVHWSNDKLLTNSQEFIEMNYVIDIKKVRNDKLELLLK